MNATSKTKMLALFAAVVVISVATNLATDYFKTNEGTVTNSQGFQVPASYANFSGAASAMETDFTVAAELSIHAVVHVKTKTPMQVQQFGFPNDPFLSTFFGRPQQIQPREPQMREGSGSGVVIFERWIYCYQ
jgi:S1-C subfamily serine protease